MPRLLTCGMVFALLLAAASQATGDEAKAVDGAGIVFFEKKVRPVLVEHCYSCHSAGARAKGKLKGGLQVDSRAGLLRGGDSGPALVPGKAEASLLLKALRHSGDLRMPPKRKLPDGVIADLATWVNRGAPAPETATQTGSQRTIDIAEGRKFWAYRPIRTPELPAVRDAAWPANQVDRFILARLEAKGLRPAADADRETLVRRLYFDLLGLPPTPEEVEALLRDRSPDWYEQLVERLLASPHFGERWGRHWLDVARFGESLTLRGFILNEAWRYRDYVIDAFNQDVPFDRFIREEVAGDLLPAGTAADRRRQLIAVTFLTLGNTNLEDQDKQQLRMDVVDEQLDTIGRAFLAQTIGCARCHDHKFDPIPTCDYYALAGILRNTKTLEHANVSRWLETPLPADPEEEAILQKHEAAIAALQASIKVLQAQRGARRPGVIAVKDLPGIVVDDTQAKKVGEWKVSQFSGSYIGSGYVHDLDAGKGEKTLTFQPEVPMAGKYEVRLAYSSAGNRAAKVPVTIFSADGEKTVFVNQQKAPPIEGRFVSLGQYHFERNNQGYVLIANEGTRGHVIADAVLFIPVEKLDAGKPQDTSRDRKGAEGPASDRLKRLEGELKKLQDHGPKRQLAMTVREEKEIGDARIHVRGSVHSLGERVPRGFLQVTLGDAGPSLPANESGRRQLGAWLADPNNPLPARVMANRVWHWLFGTGLVRTPDNFGRTGESPSHPELLDYLAARFIEDGWSVKRLVRRLVLSRTYRLSSAGPAQAADPENRLWGKRNRRRLDAECIRDTILSVSGRLQLDRGGPSFPSNLKADYGYKYAEARRSVYAPIFRNALPELFEMFDFADPSVSTGRRNVSTVAPQALYLMNHPFVREQARHAARRLLAEKERDRQGRIARAYRLALGRLPTEAERRIAAKFLRGTEEDWTMLFQALFASMDFRYEN